MPLKVGDEKQIISYLLGTLPEEEQARIEERFFRDAEYRETIRAVEDDLIDEYVRGELSPSERDLFEKRFVSLPHRRQKVEFARALVNSLPSETQSAEAAAPIAREERAPFRWPSFLNPFRAPGWALGFSLAALLLVAVGLWLLNGARLGTRTQPDQIQAERQPPQPQPGGGGPETQLANERATEGEGQVAEKREDERPPRTSEKPEQTPEQPRKPPARTPLIASFIFAPGMARSSDESRGLVVPAGADLVRLRLDLERGDEYRSYGAELRTIGGRLVWKREMLRARRTAARRSVVLDIPARLLTPGEYELKFTGATGRENPVELGFYYFNLLKR